MIHFCTPKTGLRLSAGGWVYLGKDIGARNSIERLLGQRPLPLQGLLHQEAARLREPFLDFVASLGSAQKDAADWWAGTLTWKAWAASDLFLLIGYQSLCRRWAESPRPLGVKDLTVVLEDPWLFHQLRRMLEGRPGISFSPAPDLRVQRLKAAALGLARRMKWVLRTLRSWALQRAYCLGRKPLPTPGDAVLIYSYLLDRSLEGQNGWKDLYLTSCDRELEAAGHRVRRFTYTDTTGYERELSKRSSYAIPTILYVTLRGFLRALVSLPPPIPERAEFSGLAVGLLLKREWWHDASRAGRCAYLFFLDAARRLFRAAEWRALVMPWEGQPPERMLALAARERGLRTVGYQHAPFSKMQLTYFLGKGESDRAPLPDLILTSGILPLQVMAQNGIPAGRLRLGGSRRYPHLLGVQHIPAAPSPPAPGDVLVILPIDPFPARHLLAAVARGYPEGGRDFRFLVQPHPAAPWVADDLPFPAKVVHSPLTETLPDCGLVVFTGSTAGIEAWSLGHRVLRYRPDTLLDVDPCDVFDDETLPTAGDADLPEKLEALRRAPPPPRQRLETLLRQLFAPVDEKAWREAVLGTAY